MGGRVMTIPVEEFFRISNDAARSVQKKDLQFKIMDYIVNEKGLHPEGAAGILGNIAQEADFKPTAEEKPGTDKGGYGLFQHTGSRRKALFDWATANSLDPSYWKTQVDFAFHEMSGSERAALKSLQKVKEPGEGALVFSRDFERPGKPVNQNRINTAREIHRVWSLNKASNTIAGSATPAGEANQSFEKFMAIGQAMPKKEIPFEDFMNQPAESTNSFGPFVNIPDMPESVKKIFGYAKPVLEPVGKVLALPHKAVEMLVERPLDWAMKKAGIENIPLPVIALSDSGDLPEMPEDPKMTREQVVTAAGLAADFPVYGAAGRAVGKAIGGMKGVYRDRRLNKAEEFYNSLGETKIAESSAFKSSVPYRTSMTSSRTAELDAELEEINRLIAAKEIKPPVVGEADLSGTVPLGIRAQELAQTDALAKAKGLLPEAEVNIIPGRSGYSPKETIGREILEGTNPLVTKSAKESALILGEPAEAEERLRQSLVSSRALGFDLGEQEAKAALQTGERFTPRPGIDIRDLRASEASKGQPFLPEITDPFDLRKYQRTPLAEGPTGERGVLKKYYSGGPDTEDLLKFLKSSREVGMGYKAALTAAAQQFKMREKNVAEILEGIRSGKIPVRAGALDAQITDETPAIMSSFKTNKESTLGPKGTEVQTVPLTNADVAVRLKGAGDIKKPLVLPFKWTFKTAERLFSEIDDIYPGFRNRFYWPLKEAENKIHNNTLAIHKDLDNLAAGLGRKAGNRIGINQIAKRKTGAERLEKMNMKVPVLSAEEQVASDQLKEVYRKYLEELNKARALAGKQPISESDEYIPFMLKFIEEVGSGANPITAEARLFGAPTETAFRFKNPLSGKTEAVATDAFKIMKNYVAIAEKHIGISPQLERIRKFQSGFTLPDGTKVLSLMKQSPKADDALNAIRVAVSGVRNPITTTERIAMKASNNLVIATLGAYMKSVFAQPGAFAGGAAEVGSRNLGTGITKMLLPGKWKEAHDLSSVLQQRRMDIILEDLWQSKLSGVSAGLKHRAMVPLEVVDDFVATSVWWGGMEKAQSLGLKSKEALRFADQAVIRTQASASPIDRALVQAAGNTIGRIGTAFNTFSIADANYIARHVFGLGNMNFSGVEGLKKLVTLTLVGTGLNYLQRDILGMPTTMPEPITKFQQSLDEGAGPVEATSRAALELGSKLPVVGSLAFGKVPLGAIGSTLGDISTGYKSLPEAAALFAGIPGTNQIQRLLRITEGQELLNNLYQSLGMAIKPVTGKELTLKEALLGRPTGLEAKPVKTWQQKWKLDQMLD